MIRFDRIQAGDVLWQCSRVKMGNTTMSRLVCYRVRVIEIDYDKRTALVSWNGNPPQLWSAMRLCKCRRSPAKGAET